MSNPAPITLAQLFRYFKGHQYQSAAISELEDDLKANGYDVALRRDRPWFKTWSQSGKQPASMPGMTGPKKRPADFGFKQGDHHLIVNDANETIKAFSFDGEQLWEVACLARGQGADTSWKRTAEDTPPGLYKIGQVYDDWARYGNHPPNTSEVLAYGWLSFDLIGLEGQEGPGSMYGRDGIMIHGGGTACGYPGAWLPLQPLHTTYGCVRMHNLDLRDKVLPLVKAGTVFVSVYQESP